jgi:hypothetical protein
LSGVSGERAIYTWKNGVIQKVPGTRGVIADAPATNKLGTIAALLVRQTPAGSPPDERLSVFDNGVEGTVVSTGDALFGSTVTDLDFIAEGFNEERQFAFRATLADGREVIALATVPEPALVSVVTVGGLLLLRRRSRGYRT